MHYWTTFFELIRTPFLHLSMVWGIVPLYLGLLVNELTTSKADFRTAIQTGFSFIWAATQWIYLYYTYSKPSALPSAHLRVQGLPPVTLVVTGLVLALGVVALVSGLRRRYPQYGSFLGHTRFSNYFMITIYPIQAHYLAWTWERLGALALFAVPTWLLLHFGLMPFRAAK